MRRERVEPDVPQLAALGAEILELPHVRVALTRDELEELEHMLRVREQQLHGELLAQWPRGVRLRAQDVVVEALLAAGGDPVDLACRLAAVGDLLDESVRREAVEDAVDLAEVEAPEVPEEAFTLAAYRVAVDAFGMARDDAEDCLLDAVRTAHGMGSWDLADTGPRSCVENSRSHAAFR